MNCQECKEHLIEYIEELLEDQQAGAIASHLDDCPNCRAEAARMTDLRKRLIQNGQTFAQTDLENAVFDKIVRSQHLKLKEIRKIDRQFNLWRIIMKSRMTKLSAAAVIIIAVLIGLNPFRGSVTFAEVIEPILNARTVILDFIVGDEGTSPVVHEIVVGSRIRRTISNIKNMTQILDLDSGKMLVLDTKEKTAVYADIKGKLQERTRGYIEFVRKTLMDLKNSQNVEKLGEQEIEGQKAVGFAGRGPNEEVKIWADPKTAVPIRVELRIGQLFVVLKNFKFDVPIEDSLISMDVPSGYTLEESTFDLSGATEQDFIEGLRVWAEVLLDGVFPNTVGTESAIKQASLLGEKIEQLDISDEEKARMGASYGRGMIFVQLLETDGKYHYAGKGVKLGDAQTAVFWYRPKDSESYRVIYGDLTVKDVAPDELPK